MKQQEYEYVGKCKGNSEGCFLDSCGHNCGCFTKIKKELKTETVEEAAERMVRNHPDFKTEGFSDYQNGRLNSIIEGAEWMAERMYSEKEVYNLLCSIPNFFNMTIPQQAKARDEWFEQIKKK